MDNLTFWKICRIINLILDKIVKIDMDINSASGMGKGMGGSQ